MASESLTPPPSGGGYAKYLLILLLVAAGGLGLYFAMRKPDAGPPVAVQPPPPAPPPRQPDIAGPMVEIPPEEPPVEDAGVVADAKKPPRPAGVDPWSCAGDIPAAELRRVLGQEQSAIRSCYERQLRNDNQLQGDVKLQVRVGNDGKVTATRVTGNMRDAEVKNCMQNVARSWTFPAPSGGTCAVFEAPFHLTPKQ